MINLKLLSKEIFNFHKLKSLLVLFVLLSTSSLLSQQLAFPGAEGFGKYATGGRGGVVYKVTNLNDNGPGSLRDAVESSGPRTVVFEVSGTIDLNGNLVVNNGDLTIAGQTAPGGGICLKGASFTVRARNVIVRYIRIRLGDNGYKDINGNVVGNDGGDNDTVQINAGGRTLSNIIFDQCSISWSIDENLSTWADGGSLTNVSFSNNLISHALNESHHGDGGHSMSTLSQFNLRNISYIKNMFVGSSERHPRINVGVNLEWHNNLIDGFTSGSVASYGTKIDAENNHYKQGNYTLAASATGLFDLTGSGYTTEGVTYTREDSRMHIFGNTTDAVYPPNNLPVSEIKNSYYNVTNEPNRISDSGYSIVPVAQNITEILQNVGATLPLRDSYDTQLINNYKNDVKADRIDTQLQVGGYPVLLSLPAPEDSDNDGMPNDWELSYGLNILNPDDRNTINANGYTNLEHYLNGIEVDSTGIIPVSSVSVSPESAVLNVSESTELIPTILPVDATNQNGFWTSDDITIATVSNVGVVIAISQGQTDITFTTNDGGFTDTSSIIVTDIYTPLESVSISPQNATLDLGQDLQLVAEFVPANASDKSGIWTSNNPSVVEVDENGIISTISEGAAEISFVANDGNHFDSNNINVVDNFFGTYKFYNASTDVLIDTIETDMSFNISEIGNAVNFRSIPEGGDDNIAVESVEVIWNGPSDGIWMESSPLYAGMSNHNGLDFAPYIIDEGTYNFTIRYYSENSGNGNVIAVDTFSLTFFFDTAPVANAGLDQDICEGESITLTASGGTNYLWSTGDTTAVIDLNPTETTTYSVVVSNDLGEEDTDDVTITVNDGPVADAGVDQTICEGETITLTATGGTSYLWNTGETTASIEVSPTSETIYNVEVTSNNCSSSDSVTVFVNNAPSITVSDDIVIVDGETTTLVASGSDNYSWNTGETTAFINVTPTATTTYTVSSVGVNGCSSSIDITVTVVPEVIADAGADITICRDESVTLNSTGGGTYLWNTGDTTPELIVTPLVTTTYTVTVEDDYGYTDTDSVTITVNETPDITVSVDVAILDGESTTLVASGGDNYQWNTGETTATIFVTPLITTTYTVISTAVGGCADIEQVTVTVIPEVIADAGQDATICSGEIIILNASGGSTYLWNTGETTSDLTISPLVTTTYTVTVEDDYGYTDTDSVTITVNETPDISVSDDIAIMDGDVTTLSASGGDNYQWSTGETTASINVSPTITTIYTVSSLGASDCEDTEQVTVTVIPELIADAGADVVICNGDSITLNASGGIIYTWNTGDIGSQLVVSPTVTTTYSVTVEDGFGNSDTDSVTITVNETPNITMSSDVTIMDGESTTLSANGGNNYQWSTGETTASITVSPTTTTIYTVSSVGAGDCEDTEQVTVTVLPELIANAGADSAICNGDNITLNASGGTIYTWNTGDTGSQLTVSPNVTTTYTVTIEDGLGNSDDDSVTIVVNDIPNVNVSQNITIVEGQSTDLVVSGAQTYQWNTGETSSFITVSPTQTTTYTVIATANTCSIQAQVTVTVEGVFEASAGADERVCQNDTNEVVLTANQGDSYIWNTGETTQSISVSPSSTSTYSVTVTQGAQDDTDNVTVFVDPNPDVVILNGDSVDILDGDFVTLSVSGANSYEWNNGATQPNIAVSPSVTTTYEVRGYVGDCYDEKQITVNVIPEVIADAGENVSICLEEVATLIASGGDEYAWSTGETTQTIQVSPTETTEYTVTVFNALDFDEDTVIVEVGVNCDEDSIDDEPQDFGFDIFPNPASNFVNIRLSGSDILTHVYLYDMTGQLIYSTRISNESMSNSSITKINIQDLQSGIYYIKLVDINRELTKKLIVK